MLRYNQFVTEAAKPQEINDFATKNNIFLVKKSKKVLVLDVNGTKVTINKRASNYRDVGQNSNGNKWGEKARTVKGSSFESDLFGGQTTRRRLETSLLAFASGKSIEQAMSEPEYNLDYGYGHYQPFVSF